MGRFFYDRETSPLLLEKSVLMPKWRLPPSLAMFCTKSSYGLTVAQDELCRVVVTPCAVHHAAEFHARSVAKACRDDDLQDAIYTPVEDSPTWTELDRFLQIHGQHTVHVPPSH